MGMEAMEFGQRARERTRTARMPTRHPNQGIAVSLGNLHLARGVHRQGVNRIVNSPILVLTKSIGEAERHRGIH